MNQDQFLQLYDQQKSSGMTEKEYCTKHSIPCSSFQYWKRKYKLHSRSQKKSGNLIPMQIQHSTTSSSRSSSMVIQFPNGVQLEFASSDDKVALQTLTALCNRYV